jgi:hypothetical protein
VTILFVAVHESLVGNHVCWQSRRFAAVRNTAGVEGEAVPTAPLQLGGSRCGSQTLSERLEKSWEPVERNRLCRIVDIGT